MEKLPHVRIVRPDLLFCEALDGLMFAHNPPILDPFSQCTKVTMRHSEDFPNDIHKEKGGLSTKAALMLEAIKTQMHTLGSSVMHEPTNYSTLQGFIRASVCALAIECKTVRMLSRKPMLLKTYRFHLLQVHGMTPKPRAIFHDLSICPHRMFVD